MEGRGALREKSPACLGMDRSAHLEDKGSGGNYTESGPGKPVRVLDWFSKFSQVAWLSLWHSLGTGLGQEEGQAKGEGHSEEERWPELPGLGNKRSAPWLYLW